jgi:uncharacterized protein (DUF1800 family)
MVVLVKRSVAVLSLLLACYRFERGKEPMARSLTVREQVHLLLTRAGAPPTRAELDAAEQRGFEATLAFLLAPEQADERALAARLAALAGSLAPADDSDVSPLQRLLYLQLAYGAQSLLYKMALFLHGHLVVSAGNVDRAYFRMQSWQTLLTSHALGDFRDLLKQLGRNPAMMQFLDIDGNTAAGPNQNYARELWELFTLGRGQYTQADIEQSSRCFTGWSLPSDGSSDIPQFSPDDFDATSKTIFGHSDAYNDFGVVDLTLDVKGDMVARYLARKLFWFFGVSAPEDAAIAAAAQAFQQNNFSLRELAHAVLSSPAFLASAGTHIKSPLELLTGVIRALGIQTDASFAPNVGAGMGQDVFNYPNVSGVVGDRPPRPGLARRPW